DRSQAQRAGDRGATGGPAAANGRPDGGAQGQPRSGQEGQDWRRTDVYCAQGGRGEEQRRTRGDGRARRRLLGETEVAGVNKVVDAVNYEGIPQRGTLGRWPSADVFP